MTRLKPMPRWRQPTARKSAAVPCRSTKRVRARSARGHLAITAGRTPVFTGKESCSRPRKHFQGRLAQSNMSLEKAIEVEEKILSVLPGTMFRVALANEHLVLAHISGKMRKRFIRLTIGDRVKMEMSPYDTAKARIVYRLGDVYDILF